MSDGFAAAVLPHAPALRRRADRLTRSAGDVTWSGDDLVQETLLQAWRLCKQVPGIENVRPWLFAIMRRTWSHILRARHTRIQITDENFVEPVIEGNQFWTAELAALERWAGRELSSVTRTALFGVAQGYSMTDIARQDGVSAQRVHQRVQAGREAAALFKP